EEICSRPVIFNLRTLEEILDRSRIIAAETLATVRAPPSIVSQPAPCLVLFGRHNRLSRRASHYTDLNQVRRMGWTFSPLCLRRKTTKLPTNRPACCVHQGTCRHGNTCIRGCSWSGRCRVLHPQREAR